MLNENKKCKKYKPNPSQVRSLNRKEFLKTKENNLKNVRMSKIRKRFLSS